MKSGSVVVDISIDQGGCFETSKPTTHDDPIYKVEDVTHYCVTNMPGAVPLTSTLALNEATLPFIEKIIKNGLSNSLSEDEHLAAGVNIMGGKIIHPAIKEALS
ncbi:MAG: alanine dehydrogenase, partial [SAR86 cluster bacterium]|nr:alanine dehydrogenase [SAR86 cluster bacterium]